MYFEKRDKAAAGRGKDSRGAKDEETSLLTEEEEEKDEAEETDEKETDSKVKDSEDEEDEDEEEEDDEEVEEGKDSTAASDDDDDDDDEEEDDSEDEAEAEPEAEAEEEEASDKDEDVESAGEVETETKEEPAAGVSPEKMFPVLIRCAEARKDQTAVAAYQEEYEVARQRRIEQKANQVIMAIEDGVRSGTVFSEDGFMLGEEIPSDVLAKLAELFGGVQEGDVVLVEGTDPSMDSGEFILTMTSEGSIQIESKKA